jgi:hypothetical protein
MGSYFFGGENLENRICLGCFCFPLQVSAKVSWDSSRTPAQQARRDEKKDMRSQLYHLHGAGHKPVGMTGPEIDQRACPGCRGHASLSCQRDPKCCTKCCRKASHQGHCPFHKKEAEDLQILAAARLAAADAARSAGPSASSNQPWL